jgi:uncharacterized membrane protein HdeD (DUF308 family)
MTDNNQMIQSQFQPDFQESSGLIIATGILLLLLGVFAMGSPLVAGLSLALMIGIALFIAGIGQLIFAFKARSGLFAYILSILTIVTGAYMTSRPGGALATLTIFLALFLISSGIVEALMAFRFRPIAGWGWAILSGIISVLLGLMIWRQFPLSGAWAIGILIGIRMFFNGLTLVMLGLAARK